MVTRRPLHVNRASARTRVRTPVPAFNGGVSPLSRCAGEFRNNAN
jgi:hypothetical protein